MSNETYAYAQSYNSVFIHLCQQEESKLKQAVWNDSQNVEYQFYNQLGTVDSTSSPARAADTTENTQVHYRRRVPIAEYVITRYHDRTESLKMVADPTDPYIKAQVMRMNRDIDQVIITAAQATAYTDKTGSTSTTYDSSMTVASGTSGFTIPKIKAAKLKLDNNNCPQDGRVLVISPDAEMDLIDDATVASIDYMAQRSLGTGKLGNLLGFDIIVSTMLAKSGSVRECLYFHKDAILFVDGMDRLGTTTVVGPRADKNNLKQVQTFYHIGASRMDENGVGKIEVIE